MKFIAYFVFTNPRLFLSVRWPEPTARVRSALRAEALLALVPIAIGIGSFCVKTKGTRKMKGPLSEEFAKRSKRRGKFIK